MSVSSPFASHRPPACRGAEGRCRRGRCRCCGPSSGPPAPPGPRIPPPPPPSPPSSAARGVASLPPFSPTTSDVTHPSHSIPPQAASLFAYGVGEGGECVARSARAAQPLRRRLERVTVRPCDGAAAPHAPARRPRRVPSLQRDRPGPHPGLLPGRPPRPRPHRLLPPTVPPLPPQVRRH